MWSENDLFGFLSRKRRSRLQMRPLPMPDIKLPLLTTILLGLVCPELRSADNG